VSPERVAIATPAAATAMPTQAAAGSDSPSSAQAISPASGGTRKKSADTREASLRRTIISSSVIDTSELANTR
jgi:hypothetical protein